MAEYRLYVHHHPTGRLRSPVMIEADNDDAVIVVAGRLGKRMNVDVWDRTRLIGRVRREPEA